VKDDLTALLQAPADELALAYARICTDLAELCDRAGWLRGAVERETVRVYWSSEESTVAGRDRDVRRWVVDWSAELAELEGKTEALRVHQSFLERLLDDRH
jgi:hypothetical protein